MIIHPSFFTHWKVKALIELTQRPESPLWVQQLWAHCQERKTSVFSDLSPLALKSICSVTADFTPERWKTILTDTGFIKESGRKLVVCNWDEYNASLISKWANGKAVKQATTAKRSLSGHQAVTNRSPTDSQATDKPNPDSLSDRGGDRIGLDRIGYDRIGEDTNPDRFALQIYEAYPLKVGKQAALRAISKAIAKIAYDRRDPNILLERVEAYAVAVKAWPAEYRYTKTGRDTVPHPGTWFNEGRYDDDPALWQPRKNNREQGSAANVAQPFNPNQPNAHTGGLPEFTPENPTASGLSTLDSQLSTSSNP